jgi:hypothetical protein
MKKQLIKTQFLLLKTYEFVQKTIYLRKLFYKLKNKLNPNRPLVNNKTISNLKFMSLNFSFFLTNYVT